jgi:hypothetical protein
MFVCGKGGGRSETKVVYNAALERWRAELGLPEGGGKVQEDAMMAYCLAQMGMAQLRGETVKMSEFE